MFGFSKPATITKPLKIFVLTDFHSAADEDFEALNKVESYDVAVFLGDIKNSYLMSILQCVKNVPKYGLLGNHDGFETLNGTGIENIHGRVVAVKGVTLAGIQGSVRYKNVDSPMLTQEESLKIAKNLPKADILLTHDSPYKLYSENEAHIGLKGISAYIKKNRVPINIHGHQHINRVSNVKGTTVIGVYRAAVISLPEMEVRVIV